MHLAKLQQLSISWIGPCQRLEEKEMEKKREREGGSAIVICQEFSFIDRGLKNIEEVMSKCNDNLWCHKINFIASCVLKIKILHCLSRLSWLKYPSKFWDWRASSDVGWNTRNLVTKCSAQLPNCCGNCFLNLKCPFCCTVCTLSNSCTFREYLQDLAQRRASQGKGFSDIVVCMKLIWLSRSGQKWISTKQRKENFSNVF